MPADAAGVMQLICTKDRSGGFIVDTRTVQQWSLWMPADMLLILIMVQ